MEHRSFTVFFHCSLPWACLSIWVHWRPIFRSSCWADLLQLFFGPPQFCFPWGFQKSACLVTLLCGFLHVWPIHFHFFFFWFGSSSSLPGFLLVGLRCWWCSRDRPSYPKDVTLVAICEGLDFCWDFLLIFSNDSHDIIKRISCV